MINFMLLIDGWLSSIKEGAMGAFETGIRTITFGLAKLIYRAIISVYNIFERLCHGRLLDDEMLNAFSERIGLVLGLVMVFIVLSSLLKMVLDPDKISDKEMGGFALVKKAILVIVMLGVSNFVFSFLYTFQKVVIDEHIITRLLFPVNLDQASLDDFGKILSEELFISFYYVRNEDTSEQIVKDCEGHFGEFRNNIIRYGNFELGYACLNESVVDTGLGIETYVMEYNWLLLIFVGVVVLFMLVSYCISIGVRMVQLMFLEIIAPMAIVSYMAPKKDTMFSKWLKIYISTYIDVFLRIAIINFVVFIIATILDAEREGFMFWQTVGDEGTTMERGFIFAVLVIALLTFAKKAPDLIKDLLGSNASKLGLGFKSPKQIFDGMLGGSTIRKGLTTGAKVATFGTAMGLAYAGMSARSRYKAQKDMAPKDANGKMDKVGQRKAMLAALGGAAFAIPRGLMYGAKFNPKDIKGSFTKGMKVQKESDDKYENLVAEGGTLHGMLLSKLLSATGRTKAQTVDRMIGNLEELDGIYKETKKQSSEISAVKNAESEAQYAVKRDAIYENDEQYTARLRNSKFLLNTLTESYSKAKNDGLNTFEFDGRKIEVDSEECKELFAELQTEAEDKNRRIIKAAETDAEFTARKIKLEEKARKMRSCIEQSLTGVDENGNKLYEVADNGDYLINFTYDGETTEIRLTGDDLARAGLIQNYVNQAARKAELKNVESWDGENFVRVAPIRDAKDLKMMEEHLIRTKDKLYDKEYYRAKAEDQAAGISNSGKK